MELVALIIACGLVILWLSASIDDNEQPPDNPTGGAA